MGTSHSSKVMPSHQMCCMAMRINLDCPACCKKMERVLLKIKEIEKRKIDGRKNRVLVCGRFDYAQVAIKIRKKMNRRVEILDVQTFDNHDGQPE